MRLIILAIAIIALPVIADWVVEYQFKGSLEGEYAR
jgi:hypothetical protein